MYLLGLFFLNVWQNSLINCILSIEFFQILLIPFIEWILYVHSSVNF